MTGGFDPMTQGMRQPWVVYEQANQLFEIRTLGTSFAEIPDDVSLLWIVQPRSLSNETLYAIDQFVMAGGKAMIFVDPVADVDPAQTEGMPQGMPPIGQGSDLPLLFDAWGIEFSSEDVVADAQLALPITTGASPRSARGRRTQGGARLELRFAGGRRGRRGAGKSPWKFWGVVGAAAVAGAFWGYLYWRWGRLGPVIISHSLWSAVIFAVAPVA